VRIEDRNLPKTGHIAMCTIIAMWTMAVTDNQKMIGVIRK
jgi:hypothetical protein